MVVAHAPFSVCLRVLRESNRASPRWGRAGGCAEAPRAGLPPRGRSSLTQRPYEVANSHDYSPDLADLET